MIYAGGDAAALAGCPTVSVIICESRQAILSRKFGRERSPHDWICGVITMIGKQDWIETVGIVWRALIFPGRRLCIRRTRIIKAQSESPEVRDIHRFAGLPINADGWLSRVDTLAGGN